uniref:Uncharacterized protein n=1 Tax=Oryctolagus cuniculus TaxID=9986 RepID=A0A5F9C0X8_RABIT
SPRWPFLVQHSQRAFHLSAKDQTTVPTRSAQLIAKRPLSPAAPVLGSWGWPHALSRALRASRSCEQSWGHDRTLSTRRPSLQPGAVPLVSLVFILRCAVVS